MFVIKVGTFFLKWSWGTNWTLLFLHLTLISGSYSSDFAHQLYPSLIVKKLKIEFSQKGLERFFLNSGFKYIVLIPDKMLRLFFSPSYGCR